MADIRIHPGMTAADVEKIHIMNTLKHFGGNKTQAARCLDISVRTLDNKLKQYGETERDRQASVTHAKRTAAVFLDRCRNGKFANSQAVEDQQTAREELDTMGAEQRRRQESFMERSRQVSGEDVHYTDRTAHGTIPAPELPSEAPGELLPERARA